MKLQGLPTVTTCHSGLADPRQCMEQLVQYALDDALDRFSFRLNGFR
jgi:hypothetical protein